MRRTSLLLAALLAVAPTAAAQALPVVFGTYFTGNETEEGDFVGYCAALADVPDAPGLPLAGPLAMTGSPGAPDNGAYLFREAGGAWTQAQRVVPAIGGIFGVACHLSADGMLAVVGAPGRIPPPASGQYEGAAHVFRYQPDAGAWVEDAVLRSTPLADSRYFGQSVAVARDGTGAAATTERVLALGGGRAWMLRRAAHPDSAWAEEARFEPDPGDTFRGNNVIYGRPHQRAALVAGSDGTWRAVAGGPYSADGETYRGAAYLWRFDPTAPAGPTGGWVREARVVGTPGGCLGHSVALAEAGGVWLAAVGATEACFGGGVGSGYVVVLRYDGAPGSGAWVEEARLVRPEPGSREFGAQVALSVQPGGHAVLVAAPYVGDGSGGRFGAFVFERQVAADGTASWASAALLSTGIPPSSSAGVTSAAVAGRTAVLGNMFNDAAGTDAGALFGYDLSGVLTPAEDAPEAPSARMSVSVAPNPSAGAASVRVAVAEASPWARVSLVDALGRVVAVLHEGALPAGSRSWPAVVSSAGVYAVRVEGGGSSAVARLAAPTVRFVVVR